jgi:ligand-binding SRPBCC domain-containing protein
VISCRVETLIAARPEICFDAARDLDLHAKSMAHTGERAVAGRTSGLIELGEEVTWRARHFGVTQHLTSRITAFDRPRYFQDAMQRGAFRSFVHDHFFEPRAAGTLMIDAFTFAAPLGILGILAERLVLRRYMTRLLTARAEVIKAFAESDADSHDAQR